MNNICPNCNIRDRAKKLMTSNSAKKDSTKKYYLVKWCRPCLRAEHEKPYQKFRKSFCEFCGFIPVNMCQLDVDHIDGNHKNDVETNLQTLCANCHRLKTFITNEG